MLVPARYYSQHHAPSAGDDGAGVAAMLKTVRATAERWGAALPLTLGPASDYYSFTTQVKQDFSF